MAVSIVPSILLDHREFVVVDEVAGVGTGFAIEMESALGPAELPGRLSGSLCGDCAGWVACDINYRGVENDEGAHEEHVRLLRDGKTDAEEQPVEQA